MWSSAINSATHCILAVKMSCVSHVILHGTCHFSHVTLTCHFTCKSTCHVIDFTVVYSRSYQRYTVHERAFVFQVNFFKGGGGNGVKSVGCGRTKLLLAGRTHITTKNKNKNKKNATLDECLCARKHSNLSSFWSDEDETIFQK